MINSQPLLKWPPMCVKMALDQPLFRITDISMILIFMTFGKIFVILILWNSEKNLCDPEIYKDKDVMMAIIMIPLTFDKSHLTKDEKEMSPPCSATSLRNLWRIWLLGCPWMSFTFSEDIKRDTKLITFSGTFSVSIPFFSFWWPSLQSVLLKDLVPKGRYQPFKRVPGNKYRNDHTLGCPALTGTF